MSQHPRKGSLFHGENYMPRTAKLSSTDEEILRLEKKLRELQAKRRSEIKAANDKNQKALVALLSSEKLDTVAVDVWREKLSSIKALLKPKELANA